MPFGPFNAWATNTTLTPNSESFTFAHGGVSAGGVIARINAARSLGVQLHLVVAAGHKNFLTDYGDGNGLRFDRKKLNDRFESYNTSAIRSAVSDGLGDTTVTGALVMDEPHTKGLGDGNTWGPEGTMVKNGTSNYDTYRVVVKSPGAPANATIVPVLKLQYALPIGAILSFTPIGTGGKRAVLTAPAAVLDETITVAPLPVALFNGDLDYSNSLDNIAAAIKCVLPGIPAGVTHQPRIFRYDQAYAVMDYLVSQFTDRVGDAAEFRDDALDLGARDGHRIVFSMNIINGGIQSPRDGTWSCPLSTTGGRGTYDPNCRMTAAQVESFALTLTALNGLGRRGRGLLMWRYDDTFMANAANKTAFANIATALASVGFTSWGR